MEQVLVLVARGVTDRTPTLVWPWEVPILEIIHGEGNVVESDHEETREFMARTKVHVLPPARLRETEDKTNISQPDAFNPANDVPGEWERLSSKYGMHGEVKMSNVQMVYGALREGRFEEAVMAHCKPTREVHTTHYPGGSGKKMTGAELREALDEMGVEYSPTARVSELKQMFEDHREAA
jgi:hypothetical protein